AAGAAVIHAMALENAGRGGVFPEDAGDGVVGVKHGASLLRLPMRLPAYSGPVETVFNRLKSLLKDKRTTRSGDLFLQKRQRGEHGGGRAREGGGEGRGRPRWACAGQEAGGVGEAAATCPSRGRGGRLGSATAADEAEQPGEGPQRPEHQQPDGFVGGGAGDGFRDLRAEAAVDADSPDDEYNAHKGQRGVQAFQHTMSFLSESVTGAFVR